jgi:hypothetical protein
VAAARQHRGPVVIALGVLAALTAAIGYAAVCGLAPFGPCWRCGNDPTRRGDCRHCQHTGRRIRTGRRLWTYLRRLYDDAH